MPPASLAESAAAFLPPDTAAFLPSRGVGWGSGLDPAPHLVGERHRGLHTLAQGGLVAVSADALIERVEPPGRRPAPVALRLGDETPFDDLVRALAEAGYERSDSVEERGQFSVRGGLIDVFATTGREPVRLEFFGDHVERLSAFSVFTQRSLRDLDEVLIHPAGEYSVPGTRIFTLGAGRGRRLAGRPAGPRAAVAGAGRGGGRRRLESVRARRRRRGGARRGVRAPARSGAPRPRLRPRQGRVRADRVGSRARGDAARPAVPVRCAAARARVDRHLGGRERAARAGPGRIPRAGLLRPPRRGPPHAHVAAAGVGGAARARPGRAGGGGHRLLRLAAPARVRLARRCAWPCCRPPSSCAAGARAARPGSGARSRRSPTCAAATTSCTRTTASAASSASTPRRSAASSATTSTSSSAATTACTCLTTSWPRSAATSAPTARRPPSRASAARRGPRSRAGPGSRCASWPASCWRSTRAARTPPVPGSAPTTSGWRGWRPRSPTTRPTTRRSRSTQSSRISRRPSRWTGWCAATSASARPRWRCGRRSRLPPPAARC